MKQPARKAGIFSNRLQYQGVMSVIHRFCTSLSTGKVDKLKNVNMVFLHIRRPARWQVPGGTDEEIRLYRNSGKNGVRQSPSVPFFVH